MIAACTRNGSSPLLPALLLFGVAFVGSGMPALAHHSLTAEFDSNRRVTLSGIVTKVEWMNPHVWYYADVKDPKSGAVRNWAFQLNSPNALAALGWTRATLKVGDSVTVSGTMSRNGWPKANTIEIRWPDGRTMPTRFADSATR